MEDSPQGAIVRGRPPAPGASYSGLRIGARGRFLEKPFTLLGRVRRADDEADWDEWSLGFADGTAGWLADTGGAMAVFLPYPGDVPPGSDKLKLDETIPLGGRDYQVRDERTVRCVGAEGEFAEVPDPEGPAQVLDLEGEREGFATLESGPGGARAYIGKLADAPSLGLAGEDEAFVARPPGKSDNAACPQCGTVVSLYAGARTRARVCPECRALFHVTRGQAAFQAVMPLWPDPRPTLALGSRGTLEGTEWIVAGVLRRVDPKHGFGWLEYLLFHPFRGYRWLIEASGHWSFGTRAAGPVKETASSAEWNGRTFRRFNVGRVLTVNAQGGFPWALKRQEEAEMRDYIAPPLMLSKERAGRESIWTRNVYLPAAEVRAAFGPPRMPIQEGVAPNQPSPWEADAKARVGIPLACAALVLIAQLLAGQDSDAPAWRGGGAFPPDSVLVSAPIEIAGRPQAVSVTLTSDAENDWLELQGELIDSARGLRRAFSVGSEHWKGFDADGSWSEGSGAGKAVFSSLPPGTYRLQARATSGKASLLPIRFVVEVCRNAGFMSDFWITLAALAGMAGFVLWRRGAFERERWRGSDTPWHREGT